MSTLYTSKWALVHCTMTSMYVSYLKNELRGMEMARQDTTVRGVRR
jgi:hypothetical protein